MKILMVCTRIPYPLTAGFRIRTYNEAKYAKKAGHSVDLIYMDASRQSENYSNELSEAFDNIFCQKVSKIEATLNLIKAIFDPQLPLQVALYKNREMKKYIDAISQNYDVIIGNNIRTAELLSETVAEKVVFDYHDAISYNYQNAILCTKGLKKLIYKIEYRRVLAYEKIVSKRFRRSVIISNEDKDCLKSYGCKTDTMTVIPVAVRDDILDRSNYFNDSEDAICFLGKMSYQPNEEAVIWFVKNVYLQLKKRCPILKFYIIGVEPSVTVQKLEQEDGIYVTGFMENPYELISHCKVMVVPIQNGAGMQNKVLESMVVGTPTVISPIAAEGMNGKDGEYYYVATTPEDYIEKIHQLLNNSQLRINMGTAARHLVESQYSWDVLWDKWEYIIADKK
ncbi:MAG: glycosyltransferase family 4 protein [Ruthenibacterium sp.]